MDRNTFLGGSVLGVLVRLIVLSIVVGVVLSALGITPQNIFYQFNIMLRRIYDLGFGAIESVIGYLIRAGRTDVVNVAGGMDAWERAGLPVRRGPFAPGEGDLPAG